MFPGLNVSVSGRLVVEFEILTYRTHKLGFKASYSEILR